jgi:hypothetical protein
VRRTSVSVSATVLLAAIVVAAGAASRGNASVQAARTAHPRVRVTECQGGAPLRHGRGTIGLPSCTFGVAGVFTYRHASGWGKGIKNPGVTLYFANENPMPASCGSTSGETVVAYLVMKWSLANELYFGVAKRPSSLEGTAFVPSQSYSIAYYAGAALQWTQNLGVASQQGTLTFPSPLNAHEVLVADAADCFEIQTP